LISSIFFTFTHPRYLSSTLSSSVCLDSFYSCLRISLHLSRLLLLLSL
jgi:hypothetical protein